MFIFSFGFNINSSGDMQLLLNGRRIIYEPSREKIGGFKGIIFLFINGSAGFISLDDILLSNIVELI